MLTEEKLDETGARLKTHSRKLLVWLEQKMRIFALSAWISTKLRPLLPHKTTVVEVYNNFLCGLVFIWLREKQQKFFFFWLQILCRLKAFSEEINLHSFWCTYEVKHPLKQSVYFAIKFSRFIKLPEFSNCSIMTMHCKF